MTRVLFVALTTTQCQDLRHILQSDSQIEIVGEAVSSQEAFGLTQRLHPDILIIDLDPLQANGLDLIRQIMAEIPCPIIVVADPHLKQVPGVVERMLAAGAMLVMDKPLAATGEASYIAQWISQIKAMAEIKVVRRRWSKPADRISPLRLTPPTASPVALKQAKLSPSPLNSRTHQAGAYEVILIGVSTGGPPALQFILSGLSADLPVPVLIVQHISPGFVGDLARWLSETTGLKCKVAVHGESLQPATVYFAPDGVHLCLAPPGIVWLDHSPSIDRHLPSADMLFRFAANIYGAAAIGVLLTGMGADGALGMKTLHEAGAYTIAQDQASCVVYGMPKEAIALGVVDEILPLKDISSRLRDLILTPGKVRKA